MVPIGEMPRSGYTASSSAHPIAIRLTQRPLQTGCFCSTSRPPNSWREFDGQINLLYLDGWPVYTARYHDRHLEAYRQAHGKFHNRTIVLIGDTGRDHGGKAQLVLPEAIKDGFQVLLWGKLTLLARVAPAEVREMVPRVGPPIPGEASYDDAIRLHQQGLFWEAEQLYRGVLKQWPDHAGALHLLGVIHASAGRPRGRARVHRQGDCGRRPQAGLHEQLRCGLARPWPDH